MLLVLPPRPAPHPATASGGGAWQTPLAVSKTAVTLDDEERATLGGARTASLYFGLLQLPFEAPLA